MPRGTLLACAMLTLSHGATAVTIDARADIFNAGQSTPAPDTIFGPVIPLSVSGPSMLRITSATGQIFGGCGSAVGPDGGNPCSQPAATTSASNGLSAVTHIGAFSVMGVFLGPDAPVEPASAGLDFTPGGIGNSFASLRPELAQVFFIGDGRTDGGALQDFYVPSGTTRLVLGVIDVCGSGVQQPGCFFDNSGSFDIDFEVVPVPLPASSVFLAPALVLLVGCRRRKSSRRKD